MKKETITAVLIILVVAGVLLCRTWEWSAPFPITFSLKVTDTWEDEQPWVNKAGVMSAPMPKLSERINSAEFLIELKQKLADHPVVLEWTTVNTELRPGQLSPGGPLIINCETITYGVQRWSLLRQGSGRDTERSEQLERDLQVALQNLLIQKES